MHSDPDTPPSTGSTTYSQSNQGTSSGIGRTAAVYLARKGFTVLAGVRKESDARALKGGGWGVCGVFCPFSCQSTSRRADRCMHTASPPPPSFHPHLPSPPSLKHTDARIIDRPNPSPSIPQPPLQKNTHPELGEANIRPVMIDVAKADSVQACVKEVSRCGMSW